MDLFALHKQRHLRRGEVYACLEPLGFTRTEVDGFIAAGIIPAKHLPHARRLRSRSGGKTNKKSGKGDSSRTGGEMINGRAYYVVGDLLAGLKLDGGKTTKP